MKYKLIMASLALLFVLAVAPANASNNDGITLLSHCEEGSKTSPNYQLLAFCHAYINGAVVGMVYLDRQNLFCIPKGGTEKQIRLTVIKYLKENPQRLHEDYVVLTFSAMREAFPCKSDAPE